jgi:hypothetical protein
MLSPLANARILFEEKLGAVLEHAARKDDRLTHAKVSELVASLEEYLARYIDELFKKKDGEPADLAEKG